MRKLTIIIAIAVGAAGLCLATGCGSKAAKESKATAQPSQPKPAMTPAQAQKNAKQIERHVTAD
jgi:hypothetical protein